jgi:DMSO/TMAO reductase YedYZ heme-binding membrane subunit/uncharacterized protein with FMN-binding domain
MTLILSLIIVAGFIALSHKYLRKHAILFYILFAAISISGMAVTLGNIRLSAFVTSYVRPVLWGGGLAGALFIIVMITGALPNGSRLIKVLMPIRGELSIIASILTLGHNISYFRLVISSEPTVRTRLAGACSLVMFLIMMPLFITSFKAVRKRMSAKNWKKLQRLAYVFYGLLFVHVMCLTVPYAVQGRSGYRLTVAVYGSVFISYLVCRVRKAYCVKLKKAETLIKKDIATVAMVLVMCFAVSYGILGNVNNFTSNVTDVQASPDASVSGAQTGETEKTHADGIYTGSGMGNSGKITVEVEIKDNEIVSVRIVSQHEDEPYWSWACEVIDDIISSNSTKVDAVSGATYSSEGILDAVEDALK